MVGLFNGDLTTTFKNTNKEETKCQTGATKI